jgi:starch phosphorylase
MGSYIGNDKRAIQRSIVNHVEYTLACTRFNFNDFAAYQAAAYSVRDRLIEAWNDTQAFHRVSFNFDLLICFLESRRQEGTLFFP